jgi:hypothetical protein
MSSWRRLISYPELRALEDAAFAYHAVPTRIFAILVPVWQVGFTATTTKREPYQLIDTYLEHGIADAGLDTAADLAAFFSLDELLVDRAVRFLSGIGHLTTAGGRLALTDLGRRSVRDDVRYVVTRQDRRVLYVDAFGCRPLTSRYYDASVVTLLSPGAAAAAAAQRDGPRFRMLHSPAPFRAGVLAELAGNPERDRFNLPATIDDPEPTGPPERAFLPVYVVRAVQDGGLVRLLAYTQATGGAADPDVTQLCEQTADIAEALDTEHRSSSAGFSERTNQWLEKLAPGGYRLDRGDDGAWRATLPGPSFGDDAALPVVKVGSFEVRGSYVIQVWCDDAEVRRRALLERFDGCLTASALAGRAQAQTLADRARAETLAEQLARQLDLGAVDLPGLREMAAESGMAELAARLDAFC